MADTNNIKSASSIPNITFVENSDRKMDSVDNNSAHSVLQDEGINAAKKNFNYQTHILQDNITENNGFTVSCIKQKISSAGMGVINARSKVSLVFAVCCAIGCCLIPIILYYVNQTADNAKTDFEYSHGKNINTKVCYKLSTHA